MKKSLFFRLFDTLESTRLLQIFTKTESNHIRSLRQYFALSFLPDGTQETRILDIKIIEPPLYHVGYDGIGCPILLMLVEGGDVRLHTFVLILRINL